MKHKLIYVMAMLAILICAILIWNYSFQIARTIHCDSALVDVVSARLRPGGRRVRRHPRSCVLSGRKGH